MLAPSLQMLLKETDWSPCSVDLVAVTIGPGSFTGLRIGVTAAKTFAYAVGAEVIGINTLDVLAVQAPSSDAALWTILDAQRQELFAAKFRANGSGPLQVEHETSIISQEAWLAELQGGDRVTGAALVQLTKRVRPGVELLPQHLWQPKAEAVGRIAWDAYQSGQRDDVWQLAPKYYRASAAEEKAAARK